MYLHCRFDAGLPSLGFKPIARIGETGNDEYPLTPVDPFPLDAPVDKKREMITEIQARRDGELFFYVNDAVFLWPWFHTYGNNRGTATVWIQRVEAPSLPEKKADKSNS
jgi:hypothetical protein